MISTNEVVRQLAGTLYHRHDEKDLAQVMMDVEMAHDTNKSDELLIDKVASVVADELDSHYYDGRKDATKAIIDTYKVTLQHYIKGSEVSAEGLAAIRSFEMALEALSHVNALEKKFKARELTEI